MATFYWVGGSGTWNNTSNTNWAFTSGGAGGAGIPSAADSVQFNTNSGTAATVTVESTAACENCTVNKSDITLSLSGNATLSAAASGTFSLVTGTLTLNNNTLTLWIFNSNYGTARTINFGTGKVVVTGNAATVWSCGDLSVMTYTGTPAVDATYSGSTGTRTIANGSTAGGSLAKSINLNVTAGTDTVTLTNNALNAFNNLDFTGFAGTLSNSAYSIYGNLTLSTGMTITGGTGTTTFAGTSGPYTITSNGKTYDRPVTFNGIGGTWQFFDTFTQGSTRAMTLTNGTLNGNSQNVTVGTFALGSGTKTLTLGSGTWTVAGATWNANTNVTGLTVSASTGTISMTSGSAKTFSGGALTWPTLNQGGAGALTIAQSNTFANITDTVQPATVTLTAGTTQTVTSLGLAGTSGNLITLNSSVAGTRATIFKASGSVSLSFVSIKDIAATGGANFNAFTSNGCVDGGNNSGWDFNSALYPTIYTVRKTKRYFLN